MDKYEVTMSVLVGSDASSDPELTKVVEAANESEALSKGTRLLREENPEFNYKKVWAWSIRRITPGGSD